MRRRPFFALLPMLLAGLNTLGCNTGDAVLGVAEQPDAGPFDADADAVEGTVGVPESSTSDSFIAVDYDPSEPCAATPLPECPSLTTAQSWPVNLLASDIGPDVEFTGGDLYLPFVAVASRSDSEGPFVMAGVFDAVPAPTWSWGKLVLSPPRANATLEGVVVDHDSNYARSATALICESPECRLYSAPFDSTGDAAADGLLVLVPNSVMPSHGVIRGLTLRASYGAPTQVCAYGDGMFCFHDGGWETIVPAGTMALFESAASDGRGWLMTAGSDGVVRSFHDGMHDDIQVAGAPRLRSIDACSIDWAAGGQNGEAVLVPAIEGKHACRLGPEPIIGVGVGFSLASFVSASGRYVQGRVSTGWCQGPSVPEPPIAVSAAVCGAGLNLVALSPHAVYGSIVGCPVP